MCGHVTAPCSSPSSPLLAVQVEAIDPYDLLDPVDMLAQMPKDFYDNIVRSCIQSVHVPSNLSLFGLTNVSVCVCVCVLGASIDTVSSGILYHLVPMVLRTSVCLLSSFNPIHPFFLPSPPSRQAESKWSIRKEALESILPLASKPKLAQGDYNELVKTLIKVSCTLVR